MVQKIERLPNVVAVIQMQIKSDAKKENSEKSPNSEKKLETRSSNQCRTIFLTSRV